MLAGWMRDGTHPAFVIGGADGLSDAVASRADKLVSLSALTLPTGSSGCSSPSSSTAPRPSSPTTRTIANRPMNVIYLASRSPRRRELLAQIGVRFEMLLFREGARQDAETLEDAYPASTPTTMSGAWRG